MRATLHLISAGLLGLTAVAAIAMAVSHITAGKGADFEITFGCLFALTAIANLIYAFKD